MEKWEKVKGHPYYQVSDAGKVREMGRSGPRILGEYMSDRGSRRPCVTVDGLMLRVERLVANAFVPNPEDKPYVQHKNGDRCDCRAENLEWKTHEEIDAEWLELRDKARAVEKARAAEKAKAKAKAKGEKK